MGNKGDSNLDRRGDASGKGSGGGEGGAMGNVGDSDLEGRGEASGKGGGALVSHVSSLGRPSLPGSGAGGGGGVRVVGIFDLILQLSLLLPPLHSNWVIGRAASNSSFTL